MTKETTLSSSDINLSAIEKFNNDGSVISFTQLAPSNENIANIVVDDEDNTLFGNFEHHTTQPALNAAAEVLVTNYGTKELVLIPEAAEMEGFATPDILTQPNGKRFERLLYANSHEVEKAATNKVAEYSQLAQDLDENYMLIVGVKPLQEYTKREPYPELLSFLKDNANFIPGKMQEYAEGEVDGMRNRMTHKNVIPFFLVEKSTGNIVGTLRALTANGRAYLSDECVYTKLVPVDNFKPGDRSKEDEQRTFLMAYLLEKAFKKDLQQFKQLFLIGADGRVHQYCNLGCKKFIGGESFDGYKLVAKLSSPMPRLEAIKKQRREALHVADNIYSSTNQDNNNNNANTQIRQQAPSAHVLSQSLQNVINPNPSANTNTNMPEPVLEKGFKA